MKSGRYQYQPAGGRRRGHARRPHLLPLPATPPGDLGDELPRCLRVRRGARERRQRRAASADGGPRRPRGLRRGRPDADDVRGRDRTVRVGGRRGGRGGAWPDGGIDIPRLSRGHEGPRARLAGRRASRSPAWASSAPRHGSRTRRRRDSSTRARGRSKPSTRSVSSGWPCSCVETAGHESHVAALRSRLDQSRFLSGRRRPGGGRRAHLPARRPCRRARPRRRSRRRASSTRRGGRSSARPATS